MHVTSAWQRRLAGHERLEDAVPAVALVLLTALASAVRSWGSHPAQTGEIAAVALACVPLVVRTRWPIPVAGVSTALTVVAMAVSAGPGLVPLATTIALYTVAVSTRRRTAWTVSGIAALCIAISSSLAHHRALLYSNNLVLFDLVIAATALGDAVRGRRARLAAIEQRAEHAERTREQEARRRVTEERIRIARDLHDIVAHHITLVNAQAGVAQHLVLNDPRKAYQALGHIKETSRAALDELRATVGLLRQAEDPPAARDPVPNLADLDALVDSFRQTGMNVELVHTGEGHAVTPAAGLTVYRIVQEALTNVYKHTRSARARVVLAYLPDTLRVTVTDDGGSGNGRAAPGAGTGHGLIGMRERAVSVGGTLSAEPRAEGGFRVQAELPLAGGRAGVR